MVFARATAVKVVWGAYRGAVGLFVGIQGDFTRVQIGGQIHAFPENVLRPATESDIWNRTGDLEQTVKEQGVSQERLEAAQQELALLRRITGAS